MKKTRLDARMVELGLVESRSLAQRLIIAGQVRLDGNVALKPSAMTNALSSVILEQGPRFVSRGGEKLEAALQAFGLRELKDWVCADVGSSTGGFTDCLLQHGAARVYAIDVGYGILHWKIRNDPRVVVLERTNARAIARLPEPVRLITIDASFISLRYLLPVINNWLEPTIGCAVALIKPQFEAGREESAKGQGVIRDPIIHHRVLCEVIESSVLNGFLVEGLIQSPLLGPKGNKEFLISLKFGWDEGRNYSQMVEKALKCDEDWQDMPL